jgi:hypothetical protein
VGRDADAVAEPQLRERDADRQHHGARGDQRAAVPRRAQDLAQRAPAFRFARRRGHGDGG